MELARVAALRRHEVMLYEGGHKLGGAVSLASMIKGESEDLDGLIRYFKIQLHQAGCTNQARRRGYPVINQED